MLLFDEWTQKTRIPQVITLSSFESSLELIQTHDPPWPQFFNLKGLIFSRRKKNFFCPLAFFGTPLRGPRSFSKPIHLVLFSFVFQLVEEVSLAFVFRLYNNNNNRNRNNNNNSNRICKLKNVMTPFISFVCQNSYRASQRMWRFKLSYFLSGQFWPHLRGLAFFWLVWTITKMAFVVKINWTSKGKKTAYPGTPFKLWFYHQNL